MVSISRTSKHSLKVLQPKKGTKLWYCTISSSNVSGRLFGFITTDMNNVAIPFDQGTFSNESLSQSESRDNNGWRDCSHSYSEGTITVLPNIDSVTYKPMANSDMYIDSRYCNYQVAGTKIYSGRNSYTCLSSESYSVAYNWNTGAWMCESWSAVSGGSTYTVTENVTGASRGTFWYDRIGINTTTYSFDPNWANGLRLSHGDAWSVPMTTDIKLPKSSSTTTKNMCMWTYCIGTITSNNNMIESIPAVSLVSIEDPETLVSDLMKKLPYAKANSYMNVAELRKFKELVPPFKALIRHKNLKSLADLYLWWKYTYNTSLGDLKSYYKTFQEIQAHYNDNKQQTVSMTYNQSGGLLRYNVLMDSFIEPIWNTYGFNIDLANTWDVLPFSFVVDWFVNIGSTLESIDNVSRIQNMKYSGVYRSFSRTKRLTASTPFIIMNVIQRIYIRERLQSLPIDVVSLHLGNPSAHLLDGSSLIVSNKKR